MRVKQYTILSLSFISYSANADLPLSLEELVTNKGQWKLETSINYVNNDSQKSQLSAPILVQTGNASFLPIPTELEEKSQNSDLVVGTFGLRYGLTGNTDLYGSASYLWREDRYFNDENTKQRNKSFSDISFGISHTFLKDEKNPALIGFLESSLYEKSQHNHSSFKSWLIGATTYRAIDPIVLSMTTAYRFNLKKEINNRTLKAGNYLLLNPSVSFAANDRISLTTGLQWIIRQSDKLNDEKVWITQTSTHLNLGVGVSLTSKTSLNLSTRFNVSGQNSAETRLSIQHSF